MTETIDAAVQRNIEAGVFPACALTVIHQGDIAFDSAWGWIDPETRIYAITPETLFDLASVTKLFTAAAFLSLVSEGRVTLDTPLADVLPEFAEGGLRSIDGGMDPHTKEPVPVADGLAGQTVDPRTVTFFHLLTHTSGLAPWRDVFNAAGPTPAPPDQADWSPREKRWGKAVQALCRYPFVAPPDGVVRYSDLGLMLLGEAVARLHGGDLNSAIRERVLNPLRLDDVMFNPVREGGVARVRIAPTEIDGNWRGRRAWGEVHDENACGVGGVAGHAGLFGPARSVAAFGRAWLYDPGVFGIDPALAADAHREQVESGGQRRGLGFAMKAHEGAAVGDCASPDTYGHLGFTGTSLWIDPVNALVVACLTNSVYPGRETPGTYEFRRDVHHAIYRELDLCE